MHKDHTKSGPCGDLWKERNWLYKSAGYCFTTPRAIRTFGNVGRVFDDVNAVPLSPWQRQRIAKITLREEQLWRKEED
jgi:YARHG domain